MKLPQFELERFFAKYEFNAKYLLCSSDLEAMSVAELLALDPNAQEKFGQLWLGYTESTGSPELRAEIAQLYTNIQPDQVLVHTGAQEAIFNFMTALLTPDDHAIVHFPGYQSLFSVAEGAGCEVSRWETFEEEGWELDLDRLEKLIRPNTKLIVVNCPHNPTGYLMNHETQNRLIEIARAHSIILFSDEVYRLLEQDPADTLPMACDLYENAVSLGVMSKTFGLAGLRIGWIATRNPQILKAMATFKDYLTICNSAPSEFLATLALQHKEQIVERNLAIIRHNLALLDQFFEKYSEVFAWQKPKSGSTAFPSLKTGQPIENFCIELVEQQGVLLLPSNYFDYGTKNFRLGFGRKNLPLALAELENFLDRT